ncbi:MAG: M20/M25/M40 family metallo-hydrolase [Anaerolineales bacterium]|nr:M20/M25/M40 family metallo-hydrolase [Anaerolineales bacterium]
MKPNFLIAGKLTREYLLPPNGSPLLDSYGGSLLYSAGGLAVWDKNIGLIARINEEYPQTWLTEFQKRGFDTHGIETVSENFDLRSFIAYTDSNERSHTSAVSHFARRELTFPKTLLGYQPPDESIKDLRKMDSSSPSALDVPKEYRDVTHIHLCPFDFASQSQMVNLFKNASNQTVTLDPAPAYMTPRFWRDLRLVLQGVTAFHPSEEEIRALFWGETNDLWDMANRISDYGVKFVIIKRGSFGQILYDSINKKRYEIPAYPSRVADPTGTGDAILWWIFSRFSKNTRPASSSFVWQRLCLIESRRKRSILSTGCNARLSRSKIPCVARNGASNLAIYGLLITGYLSLFTMNITQLLDLAIQIQQIPAPTFDEKARAEYVRDLFEKENLKDVAIDEIGNVFARMPGKGKNAKPLVITAHLDTVFPLSTNLQVKEEAGKVIAPGIGDNSLGVASLFGIIWSLKNKLKHDVWFVANVGEEGLGDLRGMKAVVEKFGVQTTDVIGYLVLEGLALGHVYHRAIGVKRYRITAKTAGGHSWSDYGQPSAVHELANVITKLTALRLPREPRTTMNVGTIHGGTGVNVLASEAKCELDLRSEDPKTLTKLMYQVEEILIHASREDVKVTAEVIGERPAGEISAEHEFIKLAIECVQAQNLTATLTAGSTDANIPLSQNIPAVVLGVTTGGSAHTVNEYIDVEPIEKGLKSIVNFVEKAVMIDKKQKASILESLITNRYLLIPALCSLLS